MKLLAPVLPLTPKNTTTLPNTTLLTNPPQQFSTIETKTLASNRTGNQKIALATLPYQLGILSALVINTIVQFTTPKKPIYVVEKTINLPPTTEKTKQRSGLNVTEQQTLLFTLGFATAELASMLLSSLVAPRNNTILLRPASPTPTPLNKTNNATTPPVLTPTQPVANRSGTFPSIVELVTSHSLLPTTIKENTPLLPWLIKEFSDGVLKNYHKDIDPEEIQSAYRSLKLAESPFEYYPKGYTNLPKDKQKTYHLGLNSAADKFRKAGTVLNIGTIKDINLIIEDEAMLLKPIYKFYEATTRLLNGQPTEAKKVAKEGLADCENQAQLLQKLHKRYNSFGDTPFYTNESNEVIDKIGSGFNWLISIFPTSKPIDAISRNIFKDMDPSINLGASFEEETQNSFDRAFRPHIVELYNRVVNFSTAHQFKQLLSLPEHHKVFNLIPKQE